MKKIVSILVLFILQFQFLGAQIPPNAFNYSAVARNSAGQPIANTILGIQISILKTSTTGTVQYTEIHSVNTDEFGLFNLIIGAGAIQNGSFESIEWHTDNFYLQIGMDSSGGNNFTIIGTTQLLSVPYALHAATADSLTTPVFNGDYGNLLNKPTNLSDFNNDLNYINEYQLLSVSATGDTLYLSNGNWVIIPNISGANNPQLCSLNTVNCTNITATSALAGGSILNNGGSNITQRGVCWSINPNPTITNDYSIASTVNNNFNVYVYGLTPSTTYYLKAYAINGAGVAYGNQITFTTQPGILFSNGNGVNYNGYLYPSIVYDNGQEWMTENLKTNSYSNGDIIPNNFQWQSLTSGAYGYYNDQSANNTAYGKLYNHYAVSDPRNICPTGWHVPTQSEFIQLINYLGGEGIAGGVMKSTGNLNDGNGIWSFPNGAATNESGFSAVPGGQGNSNGYSGINNAGFFWSSTSANTNNAFYIMLNAADGTILMPFSATVKTSGFSVRCIKD